MALHREDAPRFAAAAVCSGSRQEEIVVDLIDAGVTRLAALRMVEEMIRLHQELRTVGAPVPDEELLRAWLNRDTPQKVALDDLRPTQLATLSPTDQSLLPETRTSTSESEQLLKNQDRSPAGLFVLTVFNVLVGMGCGSCLIGISPGVGARLLGAAAKVALGAAAAVAPGAIIAASICLLARRPWGWRLAAGFQLFAGSVYAVLSIVGLSVAAQSRIRGDFLPFDQLEGEMLFGASMVPGAVTLIGFLYLMQPHVKAAFRVGPPPSGLEARAWRWFRWALALLLLVCAYGGTGAWVWGERERQKTTEQLRQQRPLLNCSWQVKKLDIIHEGGIMAGFLDPMDASRSVWTFLDDEKLLIGEVTVDNRYKSELFESPYHYRWTISDNTLTLVDENESENKITRGFQIEECTADTLQLREETFGIFNFLDKERRYHFHLERRPRVWLDDNSFVFHQMLLAVPMRLAVLFFAALVTWLLTFRACRSRLRALAVNASVMTLVGIPPILIGVVGFLSHPRMSALPDAASVSEEAVIAGLITAAGCALGGLFLGLLPGAYRSGGYHNLSRPANGEGTVA